MFNNVSEAAHALLTRLTLGELDLLVAFLNLILRGFGLDAQDIVELCFCDHNIDMILGG